MHTKGMLRNWERYREQENGSKNKKRGSEIDKNLSKLSLVLSNA